MKVRLFTLAAVAATTLLSQGVAQSDSLERALADLNSGLVAPSGNAGVTWGGDFRLRNNWADDGVNDTNNRDFDTRMRLTASFNITEDSSAFAGFNGTEHWGDAASNTATAIDRAYVTVNNLMGDGGSMKAGRDYYTFGSGRILGSSDWSDNPGSASGVWYNHDMGGLNMHFAMLNQNFGENGTTATDDMNYVLSMDYALDTGALGTINMTPYIIRHESLNANTTDWKGAALAGSVMGFGYDAEYSKYDDGSGGDSATAWAISTSIDLDVLSSLPGISNGGVDISVSDADAGFDASSGITHGVGGFGDRTGGAAWANANNITTIGLNFSPAEGWGGRIAMNDVESASGDYRETDVSVSHDFSGNVAGWFGYAMVNPANGNAPDEVTFWTTLSVSF
ncbi:MAG: hypothetical protein OSB63_02355 [Planctomycetota bacterium]|nr:hypothetical protein [Planctomycetota bacterium]